MSGLEIVKDDNTWWKVVISDGPSKGLNIGTARRKKDAQEIIDRLGHLPFDHAHTSIDVALESGEPLVTITAAALHIIKYERDKAIQDGAAYKTANFFWGTAKQVEAARKHNSGECPLTDEILRDLEYKHYCYQDGGQ